MWMPMGYVPVVFESWEDASNYMMCAQPEQEYTEKDECIPVDSIIGKVWKLSRDARGCRKVQQAFEEARSIEELNALTSELVGHVWEALKCQHANHVLQKCITTNSAEASQFVIDELLQHGNGGAAQAAKHRFGCRIIERILEHCEEHQVAPLVEQLLTETVALSLHTFGNFVMLHLLEHCPSVVTQVASTLDEHMATLPMIDGCVGAVIAEALKYADNEASRSLAATLLQDQDRVAIMACSRWGHPAIKRALQLADDTARQEACSLVLRCADQLRTNRYGRQVSTFAAEQQGQCICAH